MRNRLAVVVMAVTTLIGGIAATAVTATSARAATACGWADAPIADAPLSGTSASGEVKLEFNSCDRYVEAIAWNLPIDYGCHINLGCWGTVSKVRVYNEDTMKEAASGVLTDGSSFTTGAIDDAGTMSRACFQNGNEGSNGTITWGGSTCTGFY